MPSIKYVKKKIGPAYLVWFQNSNLYTQLEEPAWFVFRKTVKRHKAETIASECALRYGLSFDECFQFVNDIRSNIKQMNLPVNNANRTENYPEEVKTRTFIPFSIRRYWLADKLVEFSFENPEFESYIHPLISYLETDNNNNQKSLIELFKFQNKSVLRLNGEVKGIWSKDRTHRLIGFTYMTMINEMYNKTDDFWLMTIHAAALTNGRKTILIPAESGSGKSTMAALLQNHGYQLVCDDFIPIDRHFFRAWSFPIAMSIKSGSMKVLTSIYPELESKTEIFTSTKKIVRYLPPANNSDNVKQAYPVKDVISVKYDPNIEFELKKADRLKSIKLMLDQSWILPNPGNAGIFLDQAAQWSFYELTYSNNQKALDAISKIFDHD